VYIQELLTLHSGWSPAVAHAADLQSVHLLGSRAYELYPSIDCPVDAYYFDAVHYVSGQPVSYRRSACVFEQSRANPLRRRRGRAMYGRRSADAQRRSPRVQGLTDNVLIVRTIIVAEYYDYIIELVFHQNAVLEAVCSISGSLNTHYYSVEAQRSGYQVYTTIVHTLSLILKLFVTSRGLQSNFSLLK